MSKDNKRKSILNLLDIILRISGTLSLINLAADLKSWVLFGKRILEIVATISIDLANFIGLTVHKVVEIWELVLSYLLWFIPTHLHAPTAVAIILVIYLVQAWYKKTDKDLNQWYLFQPRVLKTALILGTIDGIYTSTVHTFIILYLVIFVINHSVSQIRRGSLNRQSKRKHLFCIIVNTLILIAIYISIFTSYLSSLRMLLQSLQKNTFSQLPLNIYVLFIASISYIMQFGLWLIKIIAGKEKFNKMKEEYSKKSKRN